MQKILMLAALTLASCASAQSGDYVYSWEKTENGYFGIQKAGQSMGVLLQKANLGQVAVTTSESLVKPGETSSIFDCASYENAGATKDTVFLKVTKMMKFVTATDGGGTMKSYFDLIASSNKKLLLPHFATLTKSDGATMLE